MLEKFFPEICFFPFVEKLCYCDYLNVTLLQVISTSFGRFYFKALNNYFGLDMNKWKKVIMKYMNHIYEKNIPSVRMTLHHIFKNNENQEKPGRIYTHYCLEEFTETKSIGEGAFGAVFRCLHPYKG